jgi:hypothetical protein
MFGLSDNNTNNQYGDTTQASASDTTMSSQPSVDNAPPASVSPQPTTAANSSSMHTSAPSPANTGAASVPSLSSNSAQSNPSDISNVNLENAYIANDPAGGASSSAKPTAASLLKGANEDELLNLKQQALQSLAPLVDHLEQDPEEKFKTTMMMIQASDNAELIPEAYEAANKIADEKVRAQALLDVVNEINYFTQHNNPPQLHLE